MRLCQDQQEREFAQWKREVGHGQYTDANGYIKIPEHLRCPENTVESLISSLSRYLLCARAQRTVMLRRLGEATR